MIGDVGEDSLQSSHTEQLGTVSHVDKSALTKAMVSKPQKHNQGKNEGNDRGGHHPNFILLTQ